MDPMAPALSHIVTFVSASHTPVEDHRVAVSVPFNFVVGDQILPSGNYVITAGKKTPESVSFGNRQKNVNIQTKGQSIQRGEQHTDELVFHKYRSLYFLTDIQFANSTVNIQFPATEAEKWIQAQSGELAPFPHEPVLIALN